MNNNEGNCFAGNEETEVTTQPETKRENLVDTSQVASVGIDGDTQNKPTQVGATSVHAAGDLNDDSVRVSQKSNMGVASQEGVNRDDSATQTVMVEKNKELDDLRNENENKELRDQLKKLNDQIEELKIDKDFNEQWKCKLQKILFIKEDEKRFNAGNEFLDDLIVEWRLGKKALRDIKTLRSENVETRAEIQKVKSEQTQNQEEIERLKRENNELTRSNKELLCDKDSLQKEKDKLAQECVELKNEYAETSKNYDNLCQGFCDSLMVCEPSSNIFTEEWLRDPFINQALGEKDKNALGLYVALLHFAFLDNNKVREPQSVASSVQKLGEVYMGYLEKCQNEDSKNACEKLRALAKELEARPMLIETQVKLLVPSIDELFKNETMQQLTGAGAIVKSVRNWGVQLNGMIYSKAVVR